MIFGIHVIFSVSSVSSVDFGLIANIKLFMRLSEYFFYWGLLVTTGSYAANTEQEVSLPEVLVENLSYRSVSAQLGHDTEFNRDYLDDVGKADLNGVLRSIAGVNVGQTNASTTSALQLRGAAGGFGLVNLDGVPLFNSFIGFFPLSHYPLDLFGNLKITRGFGGERDSSRTLGGSISLSSRQIKPGKAFLHSEGGSFGTLRNYLGGGVGGDFGELTMIAGRSDIFEGVSQAALQNGGTERDKFEMSNGLLRWNKEFNRGSLDSSVYFVRTRDGMDGPGRLPNNTRGWVDDVNGFNLQETWVAQTHGSYQLTNNWETSLRMGFTQDQQIGRIGTLPSSGLPMNLTSQLWIGRWQNTHRFAFNQQQQDAFRLTWALESQQQYAERPFQSLVNPSSFFALTNTLISPLLRSEIEWGNWLASTEVRFDHYDQYGGNHAIFNASIGWQLNPEMLIWAKGGTAYRPPAVNELLHPVFGGINLKPESSFGGEIGWRWKRKNDEISINGYWQSYENLILLLQSPLNGSIQASNINADISGMALQTKHTWNSVLTSGLSYTFMYAYNPQTGLEIPYRGQHQGQFWTDWRVNEALSLRVDMTFRSGFWVGANDTVRIDSAPRLNASINYQVTPKLRLNLRGENINNELTPDIYGFNYVGAAVYGGAYLDW